MATITEKKLAYLQGTKDAIKNAIIAKGQAVSDTDTFRSYADKIAAISGGGGSADLVYVTFMSHDGTKELHKRAVVRGNTCMCPVTGAIPEIDLPTRESTNTTVYSFAGWATTPNGGLDANALKNVTEDRTVYANYIVGTKYYTVRFFDGETWIKTMQVTYGSTANYEPEKEGYQFEGWQPSNSNITADTDCYAQWSTKITFANATWSQIAEISEAGEAEKYFAIGDTKQVAYGNDVFTVAIAGFDHDDLADGTGKAGISIVCKTVPDYSCAWAYSHNSNWSFPYAKEHSTSVFDKESLAHQALKGELYNALPAELKAVIKPVSKSYETNKTGTVATATVNDKLWLLSLCELGYNWGGHTEDRIVKLGSKYALFEDVDYSNNANKKSQGDAQKGSTSTRVAYWTRNLDRQNNGYWNIMYMQPVSGYGIGSTCSYNAMTSSNYSQTKYLRFGFCI